MLPQIQQKIADELSADETLLWCGQPKGGFRWYRDDFYTIPLFLIMLCGISFIAFMAFSSHYIPLFMKLLSLIGVTIAILLNLRKFIDKRNRENTYYGLTDKNIIIITDFFSRVVNKYALNDLGVVRIVPIDDSRSTIIFYLKRSWVISWKYFLSVKSPFLEGGRFDHQNFDLNFDSIEDSEKVYSLIEETCRKLQDINSNTNFPDMPGTGIKDKGLVSYVYYVSAACGLVISAAIAWHFFTGFGPRMISSFRQVSKHSAPKDVCAEWSKGLKAKDLVMSARARHPEYSGMNAQEANQKGLEHDRRGEHADAIWAWECEVGKKPNNLDGWNDIGYAYQKLNNPELALDYANKSTALDPGFGHGHYTAGRALLIMGRFSEAKGELQSAIRDGWQNGGDAEMLLGLALRGLGDETEAKAAFQRSLEIRPNNAEVNRYLSGEKFNPTWASCREHLASQQNR
jgi:Tfp pilus assembly protein PilF